MDFITRHLPDKFYLEGDQRINLRSNIFREIIANILVHREFTDAYPATLTIFADRVETVNANIPNGQGRFHQINLLLILRIQQSQNSLFS